MRRTVFAAALAVAVFASGIVFQKFQARVGDVVVLSDEGPRVQFAQGEHCTISVLKVDGPVPAHYHAEHDEVVQIVRGIGRMLVGDTWHEVGPEDIVYVPARTVHAFEPISPTVTATTTFAPAHDGSDYVWIEN